MLRQRTRLCAVLEFNVRFGEAEENHNAPILPPWCVGKPSSCPFSGHFKVFSGFCRQLSQLHPRKNLQKPPKNLKNTLFRIIPRKQASTAAPCRGAVFLQDRNSQTKNPVMTRIASPETQDVGSGSGLTSWNQDVEPSTGWATQWLDLPKRTQASSATTRSRTTSLRTGPLLSVLRKKCSHPLVESHCGEQRILAKAAFFPASYVHWHRTAIFFAYHIQGIINGLW